MCALRVVSFNNIPPLFDLVSRWAEATGNTLVMVVTTPGPKSRRSDGYKSIAGENNVEVLVTTRMKSVATPILAALKPDLIISATFPWLLPPELLATARLGAVNLHPALLPAYRGPNVFRQFYDEAPHIGCTLHWTSGEFDTGNILSQHSVPLPRPCVPETLFSTWVPTFGAALFEGAARAIAGDPGTPQQESAASYAGPWTAAEEWLDLTEAAATLQCKTTALNFLRDPRARATIDGQMWLIERVDLTDEPRTSAAPGALLQSLPDGALVRVGDGVVKIKGQHDRINS
jgi:methionyl-tRNA formyltransferase